MANPGTARHSKSNFTDATSYARPKLPHDPRKNFPHCERNQLPLTQTRNTNNNSLIHPLLLRITTYDRYLTKVILFLSLICFPPKCGRVTQLRPMEFYSDERLLSQPEPKANDGTSQVLIPNKLHWPFQKLVIARDILLDHAMDKI